MRSGLSAVPAGAHGRWHKVYADLLRIAQWYGGVIPAGHRDSWLFLVAVSLSWFARAQTLEYEIDNAARTHTDLRGSEAKKIARLVSARAEAAARGETVLWRGRRVDPRYRFRRETLYRWLEPLVPDALLPELRAVVPDDVARDRKRERDRARWQDRNTNRGYRESRATLREEVLRLRGEGLSYREITSRLGVPRETVRRWCNP